MNDRTCILSPDRLAVVARAGDLSAFSEGCCYQLLHRDDAGLFVFSLVLDAPLKDTAEVTIG